LIESLPVVGGGVTLFFPCGTYTMETTVEINKSITIQGENGTRFINRGGIKTFFLLAASDITFQNVKIEGTNVNSTSLDHGLICDNSGMHLENIIFDQVSIKGNTGTQSGITFTGLGTNTNIKFIHGNIHLDGNNNYGFSLRKKTINFLFEGNTIVLSSASSYNPLAIYADSERFRVANNYFKGGGHSQIAISPGRFGSITGNVCHYQDVNLFTPQTMSEAAIEVEWKDTHGGSETSHDVTISGNQIDGPFYYGILVGARDNSKVIGTVRPYNVTITGNTITNYASKGILINADRNVIVSNNTIISYNASSLNAIRLLSGKNLIVNTNVCSFENSSSGSGINLGISEQNQFVSLPILDNVIVSGNIVCGVAGNRDCVKIETSRGRVMIHSNHLQNGNYSINNANTDIHANVFISPKTNSYANYLTGTTNGSINSL
jgi:hypothetical protein